MQSLSVTPPPYRQSLLFAAICAALTVPLPALSQGVAELTPVEVRGTSSFKPEAVQTTKFQAPLRDTPKSITVVPAEVLKQQNAQSLSDVLSNVPGITFSSGEGGAGWGDMFTIRGFSAEQSITVDGVRDSQLSSRNDIFNLEQAEVFKGTGSVESGVAAIGGSVNLVSKTPKLGSFYEVRGGLGTDKYRRITTDINQQIGDRAAFRLNAMYHNNEVAERGPVRLRRWGVAPSFTWGLGTDTRITASYFYQKDKNLPDFGVPVSRNGQRMQYIERDYWGQLRNADREETTVNSATLRIEHDFNDKARIRNQTRWSETKRFTYLTTGGRALNAPRASYQGQLITGTNTSDYWGYDARGNEVYPTGFWAVPRLNPNINAYKGSIIANQTDLVFDFHTGSVRHQLTTGVEVYRESYRRDPYSVSVPDMEGRRRVIDVRNPDQNFVGKWTTASSTDRSGARITNVGLYVQDHITITPQWQVAAGLRYDRYKATWYTNTGSLQPYEQSKGVVSGNLGVIFKPAENGSIYLAYSQASQPSAAAAASRSGGGGNANAGDYSPGKALTWELGTKWDLLDNRLSVTGAVFQVVRSNPSDTDDLGNPIQRAGKERVRGLELGLAGNITPKWSAYAGFTVLRGKIVENEADPTQVGGKLKNVPNMTFNLWTSYAITSQWDVGAGVQYVGKRRFTAGNTISGKGGHTADVYMPSYWVANATVGYQINKNFGLRLNANNLFNKFYYQQGSASSDGFQLFGVPGAGRTIVLNAEARF